MVLECTGTGFGIKAVGLAGKREDVFVFKKWVFALGSLVFQTLLAYFGPLVALMLLPSAFLPSDTTMWQLVDYLLTAFMAVALALGMASIALGTAHVGRWVWVIPMTNLAFFLIWEALVAPSEVPSFFYVPSGKDGAAVTLVQFLVTVPTWGCCWYAATMHWVARRRERRLHSS